MQDVLQNNITLLRSIRICLDKKLNFAAYRLPGKNEMTVIVQRDQLVRELNDPAPAFPAKGFLICPFSRENGDKTYLLRPDFILNGNSDPCIMDEIQQLPGHAGKKSTHVRVEETTQDEYIRQIKDIIERIHAGEFEKVVLSRVKMVEGNYASKLPGIYEKLCETYPEAFVYLLCINGNCWIGASPEPFICAKDDKLITVSLAGTRSFGEKNMDIRNWNKKELQEQEYVTRHIERVLVDFKVESYKKNGPYTFGAGNLSHLRTDFIFPAASAGTRLPALISALHPTPAVCGMASGKAMDYIHSAEKHSREYYSGFLGPVGIDDRLQLYVNLRCMKVLEERLILYIGGGITHDSDPAEEWEETEIKADTLLSVLQQIK